MFIPLLEFCSGLEIFKILRSDDLLFFRNSIVQQYVNDVKSGKIAPIRQIGAYSTMWQFYSEEPYHNAWNKDKILKTYKGNTNYFELLFMNYGFKIENQNYGNVSISNKDVSFPLYSTDGIPEFELIAIIGRWAYIAFRYYDSVSRECFLFPDEISQPFIYKADNKCQHCGGEFKGIFNKVCSKCGKPKDY